MGSCNSKQNKKTKTTQKLIEAKKNHPEKRNHKMSDESIEVPEALKKLIEEIAEREGINNYDTEYKTISTEGANYMGSLFVIDVKSENRELNLFGKVSNTPEQARGMINAHEVYVREIFVYTTLASIFNSLETKHSLSDEHKFNITKFYGSDTTDLQEMLVLDNLIKKGYILYDRFKSIDWEYAKAALDQIAKFHALSYALKHEDPEKFDEHITSKNSLIFNQDGPDKSAMASYLEGLVKTAVSAVREEHVPALVKFCEKYEERWYQYMVPDDYSVLTHADFRASNIMVKYEDGAVTSLHIVDYQTICYGSPINDLLYFLFTGTDQQFRKRHYESSIQYYYNSLARALQRFNLDIDDVYPRSIFYHHLREKLLYGLTLGIGLLPIVLVKPEDAPTMDNILETRLTGTELFNERFRGIVEDMVNWGVLKI